MRLRDLSALKMVSACLCGSFLLTPFNTAAAQPPAGPSMPEDPGSIGSNTESSDAVIPAADAAANPVSPSNDSAAAATAEAAPPATAPGLNGSAGPVASLDAPAPAPQAIGVNSAPHNTEPAAIGVNSGPHNTAPEAIGVDSDPQDTSEGAPPKPEPRYMVGVRAGYSRPYGSAARSLPMTDWGQGAIPIELNLGARSASGGEFGIYLQFAPMTGSIRLEDCEDCSTTSFRIGAAGARHFNSEGIVDPWFGFSLGFETLRVSESQRSSALSLSGDLQTTSITHSLNFTGLDIGAQAGLDFGGRSLQFGPYASAQYGYFLDLEERYECDSQSCGEGYGVQESIGSDARRSHFWLTAGLKGTFLR